MEDFTFADRLRYFFLRDYFFFGEDFHGVDSMSVFLSDLKDFAKGTSADHFEKVEIARGEWDFRRWRLFVGYLEVKVA